VTATEVILFIALACFIIEQFEAKGRSIAMWGGILVCVALLWSPLFSLFD
jgi:drug/metabolite transporter superfamily protein YnfA